ncbi:hypothetical protein BaRGS_00028612 [Batillaria attramentaria]|uniref:Uncharacterized protein n=1 Tax=Batillaria attramentaria TaxID=370345 RepID=A0ABD0JZ74_9CAEN
MLLNSPRSPQLKRATERMKRTNPVDKRRNKYLDKVVEQIQEGRIIRTFQYHYSAKGAENPCSMMTARRSLSMWKKSMENADPRKTPSVHGSPDNADPRKTPTVSGGLDQISKSSGSTPLSVSPENRSLTLQNVERAEKTRGVREKRNSFAERDRGGSMKCKKLPNISVTVPKIDQDPTIPSSRSMRNSPRSPNSVNPKDNLLNTTSGPYFSPRARPPSAHSSSDSKNSSDSSQSRLGKLVDDLTAVKRFHQKTHHQWKRMKTYHELLIERRLLRKRGIRQRIHNLFRPKEPEKMTAGDRIRKVLRRAQYYGDDIKRLVRVQRVKGRGRNTCNP